MPTPESILLAILGGAAFGTIVHLIGSTWQRLAVLLTVLTILQTLPQQIYRSLESGEWLTHELSVVLILRFTFIVAAVAVVALIDWRNDE